MEEKKISNIILDYCEGRHHLEFSRDDLPKMVDDIKELLIKEIRRLKEENAELKDQIEFDNGKLGGFC